jgi:hypothetical protein
MSMVINSASLRLKPRFLVLLIGLPLSMGSTWLYVGGTVIGGVLAHQFGILPDEPVISQDGWQTFVALFATLCAALGAAGAVAGYMSIMLGLLLMGYERGDVNAIARGDAYPEQWCSQPRP